MSFYKGCEGLSFFLSVHVIFLLQIFLVLNIEDELENSIILLFHKIIFYIILFLTFYSHLLIAITDPGSIDYNNNLDIIEFFYFIYRDIISENNNIRKKTKRFNKHQIDEEKYNPHSDEDDKKFEKKTSIGTKLKREIDKTFGIETSRCFNCYVVRPQDAHHCTTCHNCILDHDHHCPWINNCVGLFNRKYFILFNIYAFISVIHCSYIFYYYVVYKNNKSFSNSFSKNLIAIFWGLFAFIYGLFVGIMVIEQRDNVLKEFNLYNNNKDKKRKLMGIKMRIIFGGEFNYKWFLPFYEGGKRQIFYFIRKKKYEINMKNKMEKDKNSNEMNNNDKIPKNEKEKNE